MKYKTYEEYKDDVSRPGKFQGEQPYVPYFWECFLDGFADRDNGSVLEFDVWEEDKKLFPELKNRHTVKLVEEDNGFVTEVR
jgi:hypothetical protein